RQRGAGSSFRHAGGPEPGYRHAAARPQQQRCRGLGEFEEVAEKPESGERRDGRRAEETKEEEGVQFIQEIQVLQGCRTAFLIRARMLGLIHDAVVFLLEQLEGAHRCQRHTFRFFKQFSQEDDLPVNPTGCARSELYVRKTLLFLQEQTSQLFLCTVTGLVMSKNTAIWSAIHGRGLFCKRNIEAGEMVIEYAGIVIRSVLTDKREKYYDGKGIGCYMFRIDDFDVVDATMHGNAARFINHSCEPNCYSRVINVEGRKHIVIFALRKIYRGEELTYDYKFPIEDASNKLNCNCGARRCRRFLN
uniref:Lysine (K)-specific methyltransferase 2Bb n=1 Tax=Fundulus heteroclitus TaxID=8078 RepID=A0A3Q2PD51_FUNHE